MNNVHPTIGNLLASILRMPPAKVQPCDNCGPRACEFYPCENITDPENGPDAIAPKGAEE
jgi:hypothetical protein